jgi:AsmA protein
VFGRRGLNPVKLVRTFFSILILLIFICVMALFLLVYTIDPNKLKPIITAEVKKKTGQELVIEGQLAWTFYPRLAVKIDSLTLSEQGDAAPFLHLKNIKIGMELIDLLRRRDSVPGSLYVGSVNFKNIHAENVWANLRWQKNGFILEPIKGVLYGGTLQGVIEGSGLGTLPILNFDLQLDDIQLRPLLDDLHGKNAQLKIDGLASLKFKGRAIGKTKQQLLNDLNGDLHFGIDQGVVEGIDFNYFMQTADALINRRKIEDLKASDHTAFDKLTGTVTIKNGTARTNDLLLVSQAFVAKGNGSLVLASQHIDASLTITPMQDDRIPWKIPLLIGDNIKNPTIRLNMGEIQKLIIKKEIDKIKLRAKDQIKKHVPGKTGEFLQKILGD